MNPSARVDDECACIACGSANGSSVLFELSRPIRQCGTCGLVSAEPSSDAAYTEYAERYYRQGVYADYLKDRPAIHKNAARTLAQLERLIEGRRLLDVG